MLQLQNMLQTCVGDSYDIKDVHGNPHEMDLRIRHLETGTKIIFDAKNYKDNIELICRICGRSPWKGFLYRDVVNV